MVIVDTTVWIDYLGGVENAETDWLDREADRQRLGLTDLNLCEVLQGIRDDTAFGRVLRDLRRFEVFETGGAEFPEPAAAGLYGAEDNRLLDCHVLHPRETFAAAQGSGLRCV